VEKQAKPEFSCQVLVSGRFTKHEATVAFQGRSRDLGLIKGRPSGELPTNPTLTWVIMWPALENVRITQDIGYKRSRHGTPKRHPIVS